MVTAMGRDGKDAKWRNRFGRTAKGQTSSEKRGQERLIDDGGGAHTTYDTKRNVKKLTNVRAL